jgi:membrane-bound lytic murein transglycosylase D
MPLRLKRRFLLTRKISLIGTVFLLFLTVLSPVAAQDTFYPCSTNEEQVSTPREMEVQQLDEIPTSHLSSDGERGPIETLAFPTGDDPKDDLPQEILLKEEPKQESDFDIPIVVNAKVEQFIQYFQTTIRDRFTTWLARSEKYVPFMKSLLKEQGLPEDLVYMALIESGFDPYAYSRSKASGPWQFIRWTGKKYGLRVDWWVDERRDPEKSTIAAAKYLKDLYETFECWYLAAAGYNAGEYKIIRAMKRYRTEDFWKLTKYRYLKRETKNYVPQMIAAALIAKDPEKYGFTDVEYEEPLQYEKVKVSELTALSLVAKACETSLEQIKDLNPELKRGVTPPNEPEYEIKIPFGKKDLFLKNLEALGPLEPFEFKTHRVKSGDTLGRIARSYRVDLKPLLEINHLKKTSRISKGMILLIPVSKDEKIKAFAVARKKNGKVQNRKPEKRSLSL